MKLASKKQELVNYALEAPFQKELENFLKAGIIFSVHPGWISNWVPTSKATDHIRTCIHLHTFNQSIMRNPFPPLSMEMDL